MTVRNVSEAKAELSALLVLVEQGEDVIITRAGKPIARMVPVPADRRPAGAGSLAGQIWISPDFDDPDPEFNRLFYGDDA